MVFVYSWNGSKVAISALARTAPLLTRQFLYASPERPGPVRGQHRPKRGDQLVLLDERTDRALRIRAHPTPLALHGPHRLAHRRSVNQPHLQPAMSVCNGASRTAVHRLRRRLHRDRQPAAVVSVHREHVRANRWPYSILGAGLQTHRTGRFLENSRAAVCAGEEHEN